MVPAQQMVEAWSQVQKVPLKPHCKSQALRLAALQYHYHASKVGWFVTTPALQLNGRGTVLYPAHRMLFGRLIPASELFWRCFCLHQLIEHVHTSK